MHLLALATKGARIEVFEELFSGTRTTSETGRGPHEAIPLERDVVREPRRATERILAPVADQPQSSAKAVRGEHEENGDAAAATRTSSNLNQAPPSLQPACSSARGLATLDDRLDASPSVEKRGLLYAISGGSLNLVFGADIALVKSTLMSTPGKPTKPKLYKILPKSRGESDHSKPILSEEIWEWNTAEFLKAIANRACRPNACHTTHLTFTCNWDKREAFVVNRCGGGQY